MLAFADGDGLLNRNGLKIYFGELIGDPSQIINEPVGETPQCAPADLNCDEVVDVLDLLILLANWG